MAITVSRTYNGILRSFDTVMQAGNRPGPGAGAGTGSPTTSAVKVPIEFTATKNDSDNSATLEIQGKSYKIDFPQDKTAWGEKFMGEGTDTKGTTGFTKAERRWLKLAAEIIYNNDDNELKEAVNVTPKSGDNRGVDVKKVLGEAEQDLFNTKSAIINNIFLATKKDNANPKDRFDALQTLNLKSSDRPIALSNVFNTRVPKDTSTCPPPPSPPPSPSPSPSPGSAAESRPGSAAESRPATAGVAAAGSVVRAQAESQTAEQAQTAQQAQEKLDKAWEAVYPRGKRPDNRDKKITALKHLNSYNFYTQIFRDVETWRSRAKLALLLARDLRAEVGGVVVSETYSSKKQCQAAIRHCVKAVEAVEAGQSESKAQKQTRVTKQLEETGYLPWKQPFDKSKGGRCYQWSTNLWTNPNTNGVTIEHTTQNLKSCFLQIVSAINKKIKEEEKSLLTSKDTAETHAVMMLATALLMARFHGLRYTLQDRTSAQDMRQWAQQELTELAAQTTPDQMQVQRVASALNKSSMGITPIQQKQGQDGAEEEKQGSE